MRRLQTGSRRRAAERSRLETLSGKVAIANAKLAYQYFKKAFAGPRWEALTAKGAKKQRLLWASTSTKNKALSDVLYVDSLIGPDTVNTIPTETMDAFRDHGHPAATLDANIGEAHETLESLERAGISLNRITDELTDEGVALFADAADKLYGSLAEKREKILDGQLLRMSASFGDAQRRRREGDRQHGRKTAISAACGRGQDSLDQQGRRQMARLARHRRAGKRAP